MQKSKDFSWAIFAVVAVIVVIGVWAFTQNKDDGNLIPGNILNQEDDKEVKVFNLSSKPFEFSEKEIRVKKGDRVRINLSVAQGFHDLVIDEFNVKTKQMNVGETDSVEFTADKTGTFEYYCSVPNHRQMGMVGKLIVE